jgi:hypothetical protein
MLKFCVENFHNLEKSMSYDLPFSHEGEPSGQNRCASGIRNIQSNTHGLTLSWMHDGISFDKILPKQVGYFETRMN